MDSERNIIEMTSEELIRANGEAEARELEQTRECLREADEIIREVREFNFKNIELQEHIYSQISNLESLVNAARAASEEARTAAGSAREATEDIKAAAGTAREATEDIRAAVGTAREASEDVKAAAGTAREATEDVKAAAGTAREASEDVKAAAGTAREASEDVKAAAGSVREATEDINAKALTTGETTEAGTGSDVSSILEELKEELGRISNELSETIHREDVKVYKNVQASMEKALDEKMREVEENSERTRESSEKQYKILLALIAVTLLSSCANFVMWILNFLKLM